MLLDSDKFNKGKINDIFDEDAAQNDAEDAEQMAAGLESDSLGCDCYIYMDERTIVIYFK